MGGVITQDPDVVLFLTIFDTEENSAAAYVAAKESHADYSDGLIDDQETLLQNYYGVISFTGDDPHGDINCVKGFDVGDYLSARMFYKLVADRPQAAAAVSGNYIAWTAVESFDSYIASNGMGEYVDNNFYFETFNDEDDSADANQLALQNTNLDPTTSLIYNVLGQVVFDSDNSGADGECESVADIIRSNPNLSHFEDIYEAATNAEGYYIGADTWTVFAPTDEAVENSGLVIDDVSDYSAIRLLLFHEVKDQILTMSDLNCDAGDNLIEMGSGQATRTICSKDIPIGQKGGGNDTPAYFVSDPIVGCNGVVQMVDQVLLPPSTVGWYSGLGLE